MNKLQPRSLPVNIPLPEVLIIGAGMYVCGRGTSSFGTILPTLVQAQRAGIIGQIRIAATSQTSIEQLEKRLHELNKLMGTNTQIIGYPNVGKDPHSYKTALAETSHPACAIVAVPDHLHHQITSEVIKHGIHPLIVKPFTPTVTEGLQLIELTNSHNVYGAVEFHKRFDESNLVLRQAISDGKLGDLSYVTVEYSQKRLVRDIFSSWINETNIFQYLGVHYVDLIYFLTNALPVKALATSQCITSSYPDSIQAIIEWQAPSGMKFVSTITTNWIDPNSTSAMSDQKITVVGSKGRFQADQKNRGVQLITENSSGMEEINPYFSQIYKNDEDQMGVHGYGPKSITRFIEDVIQVVSDNVDRTILEVMRPSFTNALVSTSVIEAVNISLENGNEWVSIQPTTGLNAIPITQ